MARNQVALLSIPIVWWRKPYGGLPAGMEYLPREDVREAPTIELSFLAGETERVFEPPIGTLEISFIRGFGSDSLQSSSQRVGIRY